MNPTHTWCNRPVTDPTTSSPAKKPDCTCIGRRLRVSFRMRSESSGRFLRGSCSRNDHEETSIALVAKQGDIQCNQPKGRHAVVVFEFIRSDQRSRSNSTRRAPYRFRMLPASENISLLKRK
jgi:hypothetical protein